MRALGLISQVERLKQDVKVRRGTVSSQNGQVTSCLTGLRGASGRHRRSPHCPSVEKPAYLFFTLISLLPKVRVRMEALPVSVPSLRLSGSG